MPTLHRHVWSAVTLLLLVCACLYMYVTYINGYSTVVSPVECLTRIPPGNRSSDVEQQRKSLFQKPRPGMVYDCVMWTQIPARHAQAANDPGKTLEFPSEIAETDDQRQKSFVNVYKTQTWGGELKITKDDPVKYKASGPGSALTNSQGVIAVLHTMIDRLKLELRKDVIRVLDLPCGDHQYMAYFLKTRDDIEYTGVDIVPELIATHKNTYIGNARLTFKHMDIVRDSLEESYDIILCRMMLQHLKDTDVLKALYHFSNSSSKYLIATTFPNTLRNQKLDTRRFRFRALNLEISPIKLTQPVCSSLEPISGDDHYLSMWRLPLTQKTGK